MLLNERPYKTADRKNIFSEDVTIVTGTNLNRPDQFVRYAYIVKLDSGVLKGARAPRARRQREARRLLLPLLQQLRHARFELRVRVRNETMQLVILVFLMRGARHWGEGVQQNDYFNGFCDVAAVPHWAVCFGLGSFEVRRFPTVCMTAATADRLSTVSFHSIVPRALREVLTDQISHTRLAMDGTFREARILISFLCRDAGRHRSPDFCF